MQDESDFLRTLALYCKNGKSCKFFKVNDIAKECGHVDKNRLEEILTILQEKDYIQIIRTPNPTVKITELGVSYVNNRIVHGADDSIEKKDIRGVVKVLVIASDPSSVDKLELDKEVREIENRIKLSKYRENINLKSCWAVRTQDLFQSLNEENPDIVHFSGHGGVGHIVLQDDKYDYKNVSCEALLSMFRALEKPVQLVVFNNCHSDSCARDIVSVVDSAIGMSDSVSDSVAIVFAAQLYSAIGFGLTIEKSYKQAIAQIMLDGLGEESIPKLYCHRDIDISTMRIIDAHS